MKYFNYESAGYNVGNTYVLSTHVWQMLKYFDSDLLIINKILPLPNPIHVLSSTEIVTTLELVCIGLHTLHAFIQYFYCNKNT